MPLDRIGLNDWVTVGPEALVEFRGREGRVLNIRSREALLTFEDGSSAWFFFWHLRPAPSSRATREKT
jgi:hypothetical protein